MPTRYTVRGSGFQFLEDCHDLGGNDEFRPGSFVPALCSGNELKLLRWGLTPVWAKEDIGLGMANLRREKTLNHHPFTHMYARKRCLVPCVEFYEWRDGEKFGFKLRSGEVMHFAGIWDSWIDPNGSDLESMGIINTYPNPLIIKYKLQMPCLLDSRQAQVWMNLEIQDHEALKVLLRGAEADVFQVTKC